MTTVQRDRINWGEKIKTINILKKGFTVYDIASLRPGKVVASNEKVHLDSHLNISLSQSPPRVGNGITTNTLKLITLT